MLAFKRCERLVAEGMVILSALLLAAIVGLFVMEIFMRYAMNAPTKWTNDVISFIMPAMIFLALPEVTRRKQHIAITFLVEAMGESAAAAWDRVLAFVSACVSALMAWIITASALKQFSTGIMTNTVIQVSKWVLLSPIAISFGIIAVIFLTTALSAKEQT